MDIDDWTKKSTYDKNACILDIDQLKLAKKKRKKF